MQCNIRERRDVSKLRAREDRKYNHKYFGPKRSQKSNASVKIKHRKSALQKEEMRQTLIQSQLDALL